MIKRRKPHHKKPSNVKVKKADSYRVNFLLMAIFIVPVFILISCTSLITPPGEKIDVETMQEETASSGFPEETSQDTIGLEEEPLEDIDYGNLKTGADMEGYIPSFLCTNRNNYIKINITNTSDFTWRNKRPGIVRIGYHYYGQDVDYVEYDKTSRTELPGVVNPGDTVSVYVLVDNIENPGHYVIQLDPVIEGNERPEDNFWFSSKGVKMIEGLCYFDSCID